MEAKHTPGPWFTSQPHGTIYIESRLRGSTIQEVASCGPTESQEQQAANARLIAAAPELLAALQEAVDCGMVPTSSASDGGASAYSIQVAVADKIRAAIAKATGASHE